MWLFWSDLLNAKGSFHDPLLYAQKMAARPLRPGARCVWGWGSSGFFGGHFSKLHGLGVPWHWVVCFAWFSWPRQKAFPSPGWKKLQQQSFSCLKVNRIAASPRPEKQEQGHPAPALNLGEPSQGESKLRGSSP